MSPVLKLKDHNEEKEIDFELKFLLHLSTRERFQMMFNKTKEMRQLLPYEYREPFKVVKRK